MQELRNEDPIPAIPEAIDALWCICGATTGDELTEVLGVMRI